MINALSIDLEDYYHAIAFEKIIGPAKWDNCPSRIVRNVNRLLEILNKHKVKATFFVLGWQAQRVPDLIKQAAAAGHEIASHGYGHKLIYTQTPDEFKTDVETTKKLLEQLTGNIVCGYRAPAFSIVDKTLWALDILIQAGYLYDSSIFPIIHDRYGIPGAERFIHQISRKNGKITEFPLSTVKFAGNNIPIAGGGYLRFMPYWFIKRAIASLNKRQKPAIIYIHPWEIDPGQPIQAVGKLTKIRHYHNLDKMEYKLERLLTDFNFAPVSKVLGI